MTYQKYIEMETLKIYCGFWCIVCLSFLVAADDKYKETIAKCEFATFRLGSDIADVFNAPIGDEDWNERLSQDFILENLGFAPWVAEGIHGTDGLTMTKSNAKELQQKGGWIGKSIDESPYRMFNHKWIYMIGDSTTRQVWSSLAVPFQGNNFERNAKEWTRHYCAKQSHRLLHPRGRYPSEGWHGLCGANEITCHISGYGDGGLLTFDWKHFPYEDYDDFLWGPEGPWIGGYVGEGDRRPDLLTIQTGLHTCYHALPQQTGLPDFNNSMTEAHIAGIYKLMRAVKVAVEKSNAKGQGTKSVIVLTSGFGGEPGLHLMDECMLRVNRAAADAAHLNGFAVLERGEIEKRLMLKSMQANDPILHSEMHLPQPAQNLIATLVLHLATCLNGTDMTIPLSPEAQAAAESAAVTGVPPKSNRRRSPGRDAMHTPPHL